MHAAALAVGCHIRLLVKQYTCQVAQPNLVWAAFVKCARRVLPGDTGAHGLQHSRPWHACVRNPKASCLDSKCRDQAGMLLPLITVGITHYTSRVKCNVGCHVIRWRENQWSSLQMAIKHKGQ